VEPSAYTGMPQCQVPYKHHFIGVLLKNNKYTVIEQFGIKTGTFPFNVINSTCLSSTEVGRFVITMQNMLSPNCYVKAWAINKPTKATFHMSMHYIILQLVHTPTNPNGHYREAKMVGCHSTDRTLAMIEYTYQYTSVHLCVMRQ
jgi:hypothetical protein